MTLSSLIKELSIGPYTITLQLDNQLPVVKFDDQLFNHIWILSQHLPLLSEIAYLKEFGIVSNFLWKGLDFQFIDCIVDYQKQYREQVELEKKCPSDVFPYRLTDYQIFDVSLMHEPKLESGTIHYFVFQTHTGLPYRVVSPFPYTSLSTVVHYQILPVQS